MKLTDKDLISKLRSLPEPDLAELLALVTGAAPGRARTGAASAPVPGWATGSGPDTTPRPGGRV